MRIVHICAHYQDKLGYQEHHLGKSMKEAGHDVFFITSDVHFAFPDYDNTMKHIIGDKYVGTGLFLSDYGCEIHRLHGSIKKFTGTIWLFGLRKKLRELNPNVIICHTIFSWSAIRVLYYREFHYCKIIFDDHNTINLIRKDRVSRMIYFFFRKLFSKRFLKISYKLVGISETCIDVMKNYFGLSGEKVKMIPLGTDMNIFNRDQTKRIEYREQMNLTDRDILIVYTGKVYEVKNVHLIIIALDQMTLPDKDRFIVNIVGDVAASYQKVLNETIEKSNIRVVIHPSMPVDQLSKVYNAADIAVWPDHLTTSTIDASACGCPIICSNYMPERVKNNNGLLVKPGDLISLKEALLLLIKDDQTRNIMGQNGIEYVKKELSWSAIAQKFLQ